jgi:two-component system, NarL family, sensor kinase
MENQDGIAIFIAFGCLAFSLFIIAFIVFTVRYQKKVFEKDARLKEEVMSRQVELFRASAEAEEREKHRISRNLHDEINPLLAVLKRNIEHHRISLEKNKFNPGDFQSDIELIERASQGIRSTCYDLIPSFLVDYGLLRALEDHFTSINHPDHINTHFKSSIRRDIGDLFTIEQQLNIYRLIMELTNNVLKHTACKNFMLQVHEENTDLYLEIIHDGMGISNEEIRIKAANSKGLGLKSIEARALMLYARVDYVKDLNGAAKINLRIPLKTDAV